MNGYICKKIYHTYIYIISLLFFYTLLELENVALIENRETTVNPKIVLMREALVRS